MFFVVMCRSHKTFDRLVFKKDQLPQPWVLRPFVQLKVLFAERCITHI